jgi:hypothetical protein
LGCEGNIRTSSSGDPYDDAFNLYVGETAYPCQSIGIPEEFGREVGLPETQLGPVLASRKIFVPTNGSFVRYLETFRNPDSTQVTFDAEIRGRVADGSSMTVTKPPSATGNSFAIVSSNYTYPSMPLGVLFSSITPPLAPSLLTIESGKELVYRWRLSLQPGQSASLLHFAVPRSSIDGIDFSLGAMMTLSDPNLLLGLSSEEKSRIKNFNIQ